MSAEFWPLLAAFGGGAVATAIFVMFLGKWIADRAATAVDARMQHTFDRQVEDLRATLSQEVERHKSHLEAATLSTLARLEADLQRAGFEHRTGFSRLHSQRADVIAETYRLLMIAFREVEVFVNPMHSVDMPANTETYQAAMNAIVACARHFDQRRIFLPREICERLEQFLKSLRGPALLLNSYHPIEHPIDYVAQEKYELWQKEWGTFEGDVTAVRGALEDEFRRLLAPTGEQRDVPASRSPC